MASFKRLIRFVSEDDKVYFGDAIVHPEETGIVDLRFTKEAWIIVGNVFSGKYIVTNIKKPVKKLLSPVPMEELQSVRCIGMNYAMHAAELKLTSPKYPVIFYKPKTAVTGPETEITVPGFAQVSGHDMDKDCAAPPQIDYETELVIVIGKSGKDIVPKDAYDYILGYTVGNDVSQRTWQTVRGGSQFSTGKMFDNWAPIGPGIVAQSVIKNPNDLKIQSIVNGELRQNSNTFDMIFSVADLVSFVSQGTTLLPGDLIFTGTPSGVAAGMKKGHRKWLKDLDECVCQIEAIGSIKNRVVFEKTTRGSKL